MREFSLWCDFIERGFLEAEFSEMLDGGAFKGATSNPSIFANALQSDAYKNDINKLKGKMGAKEIYENLAFSDIKTAARALLPLWERNKNDGYISIEIDPNFCDDAPKSIDEGRRIAKTINMPNVMIKVPATSAGFEVISELYKGGINVNATLIFSRAQTLACLEAFGSEVRENRGVISVFVSRFDSMLEPMSKAPKSGIYNASLCYHEIEEFANPHIRALFASTGVKNKALRETYYIEELAFENAINTAPLSAIKAALKSPKTRALFESSAKFESSTFESNAKLKKPQDSGILYDYLAPKNINQVANELLESGLSAFVESFEKMLQGI